MRKDAPDHFAAVLDSIDLAERLMRSTAEHDEWAWQVHRSLLCHTPVDRAILNAPCPFSRWYADASNQPQLRDDAGLRAAAEEHAAVHRRLEALAVNRQTATDPAEYDRFLEARHRFREHVQKIERGLWSAACRADALTGLRNRHGMLAELREEQQRSIREGRPCVVAMMDVDHFKTVNDRYGHPAGDAILGKISSAVSERLRPYDRIYRYGGEEFLICLPDTEPGQAHQIIERLRAEIAGRPLPTGECLIPVTVSFGLALLDPAGPVENSIARADEALYRAKRGGRNRVMVERAGTGGWMAASPAT